MTQPQVSPMLGTRSAPSVWAELADQWEGFTQASQLQGLTMTTDHQPLPSVKD